MYRDGHKLHLGGPQTILKNLKGKYYKSKITQRRQLQTRVASEKGYSACYRLPKVNFCELPIMTRCMASAQSYNQTANRRSANYQPSVWTHDFMESLKNNHTDVMHKERAKKLEQEVRRMIADDSAGKLKTLELINDVRKLGLGYRFEKEIIRALDKAIISQGSQEKVEKDLHATALNFRLLREYGYVVSQDVFESFKDLEGNFMAFLQKDAKGMLSLYEASYLALNGENLLNEAREFSRTHLAKYLKGDYMSKSLKEEVSNALEIPPHGGVQRLEARWHIEAYNRRGDSNDMLFQLAKLDFNMAQSTIQSDLQDMSKWWKNIGLARKLHFARDRLMECFLWTVGVGFEPQFSLFRKGLTKVASLITIIDDMYDVYGSLDELEQFTEAVERWDIESMDSLPDYMKLCFLAFYNTINEMAYDILKEQGMNSLPYLKNAWVDLCKAFLVEAKWFRNKYTPMFEDYLDNAWLSISGVVVLVHSYFFVSPNITKEALDSLENCHDLLRLPSLIFRLCNDLATASAELERGETTNSISCYMHETGVSEECARKHITNMIDEIWKQMNRYLVDGSEFTKPFIEVAINLARMAQCIYKYGDGHGAPDIRSKNQIISLIINPL